MAGIENLEAGSHGLLTDISLETVLKTHKKRLIKTVANSTVIRQLPPEPKT
jgi:hypothetical protein